MGMKNKDKDRDPVKARKRAKSDLRCAARKLGIEEARRVLEELAAEGGEAKPTPMVDPEVYGKAALKDLAEHVLYCLGGPEGAASKLSRDNYVTLCVCAAFIVGDAA